jgi:tRNA A37 threonylcarbamoyladenosine dehydratase
MNHIDFKQEKLSVDLDKAKTHRIYVFGYGAVGTYIVDQFVRFGFDKITIFDKDAFEPSNLAKTSGSITTSNISEPKAFVGAELYRNQLDKDSCITGVHGDIMNIGPHCFDTESPCIFIVCLDNTEARLHVNRLFKQQRNAILINCGTNKNLAMALVVDGKQACLECVLDQSSKEKIKQRHQCLPIYRQMITGNQAPTSAMASSDAARIALELTRRWMIDPTSVNTWVTDQNLQYLITTPLKDSHCKACELSYDESLISLTDCSIESSASLVLKKIQSVIKDDRFELTLPSPFIITDTCRMCGQRITINSSLRRLYEDDVRCTKCKADPKEVFVSDIPMPEMTDKVSLHSDEDMLSRSLSELGIRLGDTLQVKVYPDSETFDCSLREFFCSDDYKRLHSNRNEVI